MYWAIHTESVYLNRQILVAHIYVENFAFEHKIILRLDVVVESRDVAVLLLKEFDSGDCTKAELCAIGIKRFAQSLLFLSV